MSAGTLAELLHAVAEGVPVDAEARCSLAPATAGVEQRAQ